MVYATFGAGTTTIAHRSLLGTVFHICESSNPEMSRRIVVDPLFDAVLFVLEGKVAHRCAEFDTPG